MIGERLTRNIMVRLEGGEEMVAPRLISDRRVLRAELRWIISAGWGSRTQLPLETLNVWHDRRKRLYRLRRC